LGSDYNKNLFKQFEEALLKIDFLMEENKALKKEIATMKENHKKEIAILQAEITSLKKENQKLKDIINKNSGNSSKPPSSDGFKKIHNSREKTDKKVGGQKGHRGNIPMLLKNPTKIIEHKKKHCKCGCHIVYSENYIAKQAVDIEIVTNIVEHRVFNGICSGCGNKTTNDFPSNITNLVTYGNTLTSPVLHKDETGIRINKTIEWFHVLSNKTKTLYFSHKKRGNVADNETQLLPIYSGMFVHDHLKGLYVYSCKHSECNAHILRYLKSAVENKKREWAREKQKSQVVLEVKMVVRILLILKAIPQHFAKTQKIFLRVLSLRSQASLFIVEFLNGGVE